MKHGMDAEDAGETVAVSVKSCLAKISRENLNVCSPQDVEKLAAAAAADRTPSPSSSTLVQAGSLTAPHSMVEEAITKAVVASSAQVGDTSTSSDCIFAL
ncbi:hypothetical protein GQ55_2G035700 [Panicum hallii var. hallii]|uniref:Uncharacterized protein n=1 Tax=Panicum hallii var. hallii TaxID=1504633 RepID=A0A2T7EL49_9POAL|nr:hypothetical protein GQ55_2G035700 [Panicum hallii var. hallii]